MAESSNAVAEMQGGGRKQTVAALAWGTTYVRAGRGHKQPSSIEGGMSFQSFHGTHLLEHRSCCPMF